MRVIPPKYYEGKIPTGYGKKDFFRFDQDNEDTYGVLYSGERVKVSPSKKEIQERVEVKKAVPTQSPWPDRSWWKKLFRIVD